MKGKLIKTELGHQLFDENMKYITSYGTKGLSLKNCQAIERGYDLEELADELHHGHPMAIDWQLEKRGFKAGFQKALEILGDKKFSEEDMRKAIEMAQRAILDSSKIGTSTHTIEEIIQSLQQTEWDVEIVQEQGKDTFGNAELTWYNPKLDADGRLILKRIEDGKK